MNKTTRTVVSTFGVLAAVAATEHGIGEILQGPVAPPALVFESWPDSDFFQIVGGEPAMSLIPSLRLSGILSILVAFCFLVWVVFFIDRKYGGPVLVSLSLALLVVGGGFGPPLLGLILGLVSTRIHAPLRWWRKTLNPGARRALAALWPWLFGSAMVAWLLLFPGLELLDSLVAPVSDTILATVAVAAFTLLLLTAAAALARDAGSALQS